MNFTGALLLAVLIVIFLIYGGIWISQGRKGLSQHQIESLKTSLELIKEQHTNLPDSLKLESTLKSIETTLAQMETMAIDIEERYEILLKSKQQETDAITILSAIVAVFVGLLAFFGIKSFQDIHSKAQTEFETERQKVDNLIQKEINDWRVERNKSLEAYTKQVKKMVNEKLQSYYETQLTDMVATKTTDALKNQSSTIIDSLCTKKVQSLMEPIQQKLESIENAPSINGTAEFEKFDKQIRDLYTALEVLRVELKKKGLLESDESQLSTTIDSEIRNQASSKPTSIRECIAQIIRREMGQQSSEDDGIPLGFDSIENDEELVDDESNQSEE